MHEERDQLIDVKTLARSDGGGRRGCTRAEIEWYSGSVVDQNGDRSLVLLWQRDGDNSSGTLLLATCCLMENRQLSV